MQDNVSEGLHSLLDQLILLPLFDPGKAEARLQLAEQLAAGSDRRVGLLAFTLDTSAAAAADDDCLLQEGELSAAGLPAVLQPAQLSGVPLRTGILTGPNAADCLAALAQDEERASLLLLDWSGDPLFSEPPDDLAGRLFLDPPINIAALFNRDLKEIRRILVAENVGGNLGLAIRLAHQLVRGADDGLVTVLRVVAPLEEGDFAIERIAVEEAVRSELGDIEANMQPQVVQAESAADAILHEGAEYDLLLVGAPEEPFWRNWLFGATADDLVERAPCSVMVVKTQATGPSSWLERAIRRIVT